MSIETEVEELRLLRAKLDAEVSKVKADNLLSEGGKSAQITAIKAAAEAQAAELRAMAAITPQAAQTRLARELKEHREKVAAEALETLGATVYSSLLRARLELLDDKSLEREYSEAPTAFEKTVVSMLAQTRLASGVKSAALQGITRDTKSDGLSSELDDARSELESIPRELDLFKRERTSARYGLNSADGLGELPPAPSLET
jgi:hypothetical protein